MSKKTPQLVVKYPDASDAALNCLRSLLKHYTGKLITKTEVEEIEADDDVLELNAEAETTTTAELTLNLTDASLVYILEKLIANDQFDKAVEKFNKAVDKIEKGAV